MSTTMPYNTRRKSLSLSELGITVPKRSRTHSHPSPPSTIAEDDERPVKKSKRSHASDTPPSGLMSPPRTTAIRVKEEKPRKPVALSPPPSPAREGSHKVDAEGINDDIVIGTIRQLEQTGNRPHLVKELAAVLATGLHCVEKYDRPTQVHLHNCANTVQRSANPCALISSRLTAYLNRQWPAVSPCPLAKDLSPVHPRRLYFYLTTTPHQPIPETVAAVPQPTRIISPSISSASAADEDERYNRQRTALSPSPEVDLSSPELEDEHADDRPPTPGAPFSGRSSMSRERSASAADLARNRRAASPQLEHEERDFKQTASQLQAQQRRHSRQQSAPDVTMVDGDADASAGAEQQDGSAMLVEESEESAAKKNSEAAADLFGHNAESLKSWAWGRTEMEFSSPVIAARTAAQGAGTYKRDEPMTLDLDAVRGAVVGARELEGYWEQLTSPENVDLAELDDMFDSY